MHPSIHLKIAKEIVNSETQLKHHS